MRLTHQVALTLIGACAVAGCLSSESSSRDLGPITTDSTASAVLPVDSMVAACLTESGDDIPVDLCVVDLDGDREIIRPEIDPALGPALSPDRRRVAFIDDGTLSVVDVDGQNDRPLGVRGAAPEWLSDDRITIVDEAGTAVVAVDADHGTEAEVLARVRGLPDELDGALIDQFAISPADGRIVFALVAGSPPPGRAVSDDSESSPEDAVFALGLVAGPDREVELLFGPSDVPYSAPDFSPDGRQLAFAIDYDIHLLDLETLEPHLISPPAWMGTSPAWSHDGSELVWLANSVGLPEGPAALVVARVDGWPRQPEIVVGNADTPLDRMPAFPDR